MNNIRELIDSADQLDVLLARQPIYSKSMDVVAFELLFRNSDGTVNADLRDDKATYDVLTNTYSSISDKGQQKAVPCFLKVTDKVIVNDELPDLPRQRFVIELLGRSNITPQLVDKISALAKSGYRIVLADYDPNDSRFEPLMNIVHVLKLDIQQLGLDNLPGIIAKLRPYQLELLADKVESKDEFRQCLEMGFSLYQGYFLGRPDPVKGRKISSNKTVLMQLLAELDKADTTASKLEEIAVQDPVLTYKILKVVNSAAFSVPREVNSLSHAITLLGLDQIRRWVVMFLATGNDSKPASLTAGMLARGRMCELVAEMLGRQDAINYFIVGLLSQLDALLDIEMPELLEQVPLQSELKSAIMTRAGTMGDVLRDVEHYERGEFDDIQGQINRQFYEVAYRHSLIWGDQVMNSLNA